MSTQNQLKVAIIGQGRSGRNIHAETLFQMKDKFHIAAVVDSLQERRKYAVDHFHCKAYEKPEELYSHRDLDLIINATPSHLHVPVTIDFLRRGFHVLCEKPLARTKEEVEEMINVARKNNRLLSVFQQHRFSPSFVQICELIHSGMLGRIVQASISFNGFSRRWDWQTLKKYKGGNLLNTGPHVLDQALHLFGWDKIPEVKCVMDKANSYGDAEDYVKILLTGQGKPIIDVEISSCCSYPEFNYHIQGTNGGVKGDLTKLKWKYFKSEEAPIHQLIETPLQNAEGIPSYCKEELLWHEGEWMHPGGNRIEKEAFYMNIYDALKGDSPLLVTPEHVYQQISIIEECFSQNVVFA